MFKMCKKKKAVTPKFDQAKANEGFFKVIVVMGAVVFAVAIFSAAVS